MSRTGRCYDNAVMEHFFWSLKHEWTNHEEFLELEDARHSVFRYIEAIYNPQRLHQTLGYRSSDQFRSRQRPGICGVKIAPTMSESPGPSQFGGVETSVQYPDGDEVGGS